MTLATALTDVSAIFDRFAATDVVPGFAFGVVVDGELVHAGGHGTLRVGEVAPPDADSVYRIASMTKSFTATTVLLLRDEGTLRLDDRIDTWVPELAATPAWSADSPPMTIRDLLSMSAGLPTDDPWGDRMQGLDPDAFLAFLSSGPGLAWPVGTHFEYSNLGYAILGVLLSRAAGEDYRAVVERRVLEPLGMTSTAFSHDSYDPARLALGYIRRGAAWVDEPLAGHGAFAPMGGLFTSVRDLSRWVGGFTDAFPPRDDPDDRHPLGRAARREMQQIQRAIPADLSWTSAAAIPSASIAGYGYGLWMTIDVKHGRIVAHGGGYPGFGSHMRWHPATGIGVVGVANARYAGIWEPARDALKLLLDHRAVRIHVPVLWASTADARASVERLTESWDDELADRLFADNVSQDEDLGARRMAIEALAGVHGRLRRDDASPVESWSGAHLRWWMAGERGRVQVEILMSPERPPRVQMLAITSVPEPAPHLTAIADRVVALLADPGPRWPDDVPLAPTVDRSALDRELRAAEALFGPVGLGLPTAGDGVKEASWRMSGQRGDLALTIETDDAGAITKVSLVPETLESPVHLA